VIGLVALFAVYSLKRWLPLLSLESPILKVVAVIAAMSAMACGSLSVWHFFHHETSINPHRPSEASSLVCRGIYAYSRNPMYLSIALLITSAVLWGGELSSVIVVPLFIVYMNQFQIEPEEEALLNKFGTRYLKYMSRSRRWL
jgi:protein-S-isoprenylcysteine O-methyltransferase Ste14